MTGESTEGETQQHANCGALPPAMRALVFVIVWPAFVFATQWIFNALVCGGGNVASLCRSSSFGFAFAAVECLATVGLAFAFRYFLDRESIASLGLSFSAPWLRLLLIGAAFGAGMQGLVFVLEMATGSLRVVAVAPIRMDINACAAVLPLLAVAALGEELPVRGYVFQNLRAAWGDRNALWGSSIFFALLHVANPGARLDIAFTLVGITLAGAWFCLSVIWTRSLWLALGAHTAWNLFEGPVFGFPVSGLTFGSSTAITSVVDGPAWFTGGSFGPEAGVSSLSALAIGAVVLYLCQRRGWLRADHEGADFSRSGRT